MSDRKERRLNERQGPFATVHVDPKRATPDNPNGIWVQSTIKEPSLVISLLAEGIVYMTVMAAPSNEQPRSLVSLADGSPAPPEILNGNGDDHEESE